MAGVVMLGAALLTLASCISLPDRPDRAGGGGDGGVASGGEGGGGGGAEGGGSSGALPMCAGGPNQACATIQQLALGDEHSCMLATDGYVWCWGSNLDGQMGDPEVVGLSNHPPRVVPTIAKVDQLVSGERHLCARVAQEVWCWGANERGQLGAWSPRVSAQPMKVASLPPVASIAGGLNSTCALVESGAVYCWGTRLDGQAWDGTGFDVTPTAVQGLSGMDVATIDIGSVVACARSQDGLDVRCWGHNSSGTLGDGSLDSRPYAARVASTLLQPSQVAKVGGRACAVGGSPAELQCWGLFDGVNYTEPTTVPGFSPLGFVDAAIGWGHVCFLDEGSVVSCMGHGFYGELGTLGGNGEWIDKPVDVLAGVVEVATGWKHLCAILDSGALYCWGQNHRGQVAPSESLTEIRNPTAVVFP